MTHHAHTNDRRDTAGQLTPTVDRGGLPAPESAGRLSGRDLAPGRHSHRLRMLVLALLTTGAVFATLGVSGAAAASPWWHLTSRMVPSHLAPGGEATIFVQAVDLGNTPTTAVYSITDTLPANVTLQSASFLARPSKSFEQETGLSSHVDFGPSGPNGSLGYCKSAAGEITCSSESPLKPEAKFLLQPVFTFDFVELRLKVKAEPGAESGALNRLQVSGGGAGAAAASYPVTIDSSKAGFGIEGFSLAPEEEGGEPDARAGSHPYQLTNTLTFNRDSTETLKPPALPRDLHFKLPPGMVGNATALPQCSEQDFADVGNGGSANACPPDTAIGASVVTVSLFPGEEHQFTVPVFNLRPAPGEPARFGFEVLRNPVLLDTSIRSGPGEDYGVTVSVNNITQLVNFISSTTTFWGAPADPSHNEARGWGCLLGGRYANERKLENIVFEEEGRTPGPELLCEDSHQEHPAAFLTLPTGCEAPFATVLEGDSWPIKATPEASPQSIVFAPITSQLKDNAGDLLSLDACNQLAFGPTISARPSSQSASSPSGLDFNLNFDDEGLTSATGVAQSQLKDTSVILPEGFTINPSAGVGLGGCTEADYERETLESEPGAGCPNNSKLGTVEIHSPLIADTVHGSVFVAQPYENPFSEPGHPSGSLVALYIVAKNPQNGVLIKLAGKVDRNPSTGQLTTTFQNNPQLPFDHFNFHFREGQQAPLITAAVCGTYTTEALLTPWSDPLATLTDTSSFQITSGSGGGACPGGAPPFAPQIQAGTVSNAAGAFSPFDLRLSRTDSESEISSFSTTLPPGLVGILAGIPFCPEADIAAARTKTGAAEENSPSCPAQSLLGHSLVGTGVGAVLAYTPGKIYLAGPYNGDPFSLVSVTSAVVGPFDLGTVVIRFGLRVDPRTAQVSVDPSASEPIPTIIDGIVTHVRDIRVQIDRPNFTFNPSSCEPMSISSTLASSLGQSASVSSPFQASSCASLKFQPTITATTAGHASRANGASLNVKIAYPKTPLGTQSWFNEVKLQFPRQLPAELRTIQKACLAATFEHDRAACPPQSVIGHAVVHTPVLPVPLEGPVYFVSNGGKEFPEAVLVLSGYGINVELHGETFIAGGTGITTATFRNTPDVPFESIEVSVPSGPFSEFGANLPGGGTDFCGQKLVMPTFFKASNGAEIHQNTTVGVTGCPTRLKVTSRKLKGRNLTLTVYVPAAGKLTAAGNGLRNTAKTTTGTETLTLTLHAQRKGRFKTKVKLTFTPTKGSKQTKSLPIHV